MAGSNVHHTYDAATVRAILSSSRGGVARDMLRRGVRVASAAKKNLGSNPKRFDTGRLRASITQQLASVNGKPIVQVGTNVKYARWVHDGTGLFGPHAQLIRPKQAKVLRWTSKGKVVYARSTRGMRPNPFLKNALKAAKG